MTGKGIMQDGKPATAAGYVQQLLGGAGVSNSGLQDAEGKLEPGPRPNGRYRSTSF